ncbi:hypothetical protein A2U01_0075258, partial [Trifolium medium]|nr:hypothetical protein [Trifolium medium]
RTGSPRQLRRGKRSNDRNNVDDLHKDSCSWQSRVRPRAESVEVTDTAARHPLRATKVLLDVLQKAAMRKTAAALFLETS